MVELLAPDLLILIRHTQSKFAPIYQVQMTFQGHIETLLNNLSPYVTMTIKNIGLR